MAPCKSALAVAPAAIYPIPQEVRSEHYTVTINGHKTPVVHAASSYYLLNFDTSVPVIITVTASDPHFWDPGVEVQPMRLGIRPVRHAGSITFRLAGPQKISISRPGDHFAEADMLFLFANPPESSGIGPKTPGVHYYGPGIYHESIDAKSGETIYLAGGAVIYGSLNVWQVHDVHVLGRGMIIYDGPQNPGSDNGWMHKKDWHAIVMDNANNIEIDGITTVVRSRTWQIQMKDSRHIGFYNVKVVAGVPGDANQDGMDWLGGGDTTVRDSFFRASDDVFAWYGNWDGYTKEAMDTPGHDVSNISISDSTVSTSISNTIRVGWPQKSFNSAHVSMRNMDVLHTGYGNCTVPFAFFELWGDPGGKGQHSDYKIEDVRLDDWYSFLQIRQPLPAVRDFSFAEIWPMDGPGMVASTVQGAVRGITLQDTPAVAEVLDGATAPLVVPAKVNAQFTYSGGLLHAREAVRFQAQAESADGRTFTWLFGDGSTAVGRVISHAFPDEAGTLLDGSGRFRVLLHVTDGGGGQSWSSQSVVVAPHALAAVADAVKRGDIAVQVPADGGYTFTLLARAAASIAIDGQAAVQGPKPRARACGSPESAVQPVRASAGLKAGLHVLHVVSSEGAKPVVLWEGPGMERRLLPAASQ